MSYKPKDFHLTIGADPEIFLSDKKGNPVSAHGLVPGTKQEPFAVDRGAIQLDGTAVEFNIQPCINAAQFTGNITRVLQSVRAIVPKEYNFNFSPTVHYDKEYYDKHIPVSSKTLGCDADYNAYTGERNATPKRKGTMATGAGHVHFGWVQTEIDPLSPGHFEDCRNLTKVCDFFFGSVSKAWDQDKERAEMYGAPGAFRPKPYGMEYRTLSNAWVGNTFLHNYVFNLAQSCFKLAASGINSFKEVELDDIINVSSLASSRFNEGDCLKFNWDLVEKGHLPNIYFTDMNYRINAYMSSYYFQLYGITGKSTDKAKKDFFKSHVISPWLTKGLPTMLVHAPSNTMTANCYGNLHMEWAKDANKLDLGETK